MEGEIPLSSPDFSCFDHMPRDGAAELYSNTVSNAVRSHCAVSCSGHDFGSSSSTTIKEGRCLDRSVMLLKTSAVVINHSRSCPALREIP